MPQSRRIMSFKRKSLEASNVATRPGVHWPPPIDKAKLGRKQTEVIESTGALNMYEMWL